MAIPFSSSLPVPRGAVAAAALLLLGAAAPPGVAQVTPTVTVTGRGEPVLGIGGFGERASLLPMQTLAIGADQLREAGITSLAGLSALEPALSDAYNSSGYWSQLTARGYVLDNRSNYRRDGLPINAETAIALGNKERVEVLFGTSGIQAGTSAPGGIVNLVVKRPTGDLREASLEVSERGSTALQVDLAQRFGSESQFGARLNIGHAELRPQLRHAEGRRSLAALALDWQAAPGSRVELEFESSRQSQPSMPGFSLLGDRLPDARKTDPRTNLNNQPWSLPVVLDGDTASLRWQQRLAADWTGTLHAAAQRLRSDDRVAFPFGCYDAAADIYHADRYCPDGSFDLYDFRSEGERRRVDAVDLRADGRWRTGAMTHELTFGLLTTRARDRFQRQAYNYVGSGHIDGSAVTDPDPELTDENTQRDERSREWYLRDRITFAEAWQLWLGLRHSALDRRSVRTDGSRATAYTQSFSTPWLALSYRPRAETTWYLSWGSGSESEVVPNRSRYDNRGLALAAKKSRQWEAGVRVGGPDLGGALTWFDIRRPVAEDFCNDEQTSCLREIDGIARHRGIDLSARLRHGAWSLGAALQSLDARRQRSRIDSTNGLEPTNVPRRSARLQLGWRLAADASLQATAVHEGRRQVLPDNSLRLPSWTRIDLAAQWRTAHFGHAVQWRAGVDNLVNHRAWRESPYQFGHAYLYPLPARSWRLAASTRF